MKRSLLLKCVAVCMTVGFVIVSDVTVHGRSHWKTKMKQALQLLEMAEETEVGLGKLLKLNRARNNLKKAVSTKGDHREKAIQLINEALKKLEEKDNEAANELIKEAIKEVELGI